MMDKSDLEKAFKWLTENINKVSYGELSIKVILHDRKIKQIEKNTIERERE